jgi:hypothetical protein
MFVVLDEGAQASQASAPEWATQPAKGGIERDMRCKTDRRRIDFVGRRRT